MMLANPPRIALLGALLVLVGCKDSSGPKVVGDPSDIVSIQGVIQSALANTELMTPIVLQVRDANGLGVPNQTVTFAITAGGGTLTGNANAVSDAEGKVTAPSWRLGKSAVPQTMTATTAGVTKTFNAAVQTAYDITIRYFGDPPMSDPQKALFVNAAARISGIVVGDLIDVDARNSSFNPSQCGVPGQPNFNEIIDDVLIFASIDSIDGPGKILAQAGPCLVRTAGGVTHTAVGTMQFDVADLNTLTAGGNLQDVITHEMLHVVGVGTLWDDRGFVSGTGTSDPRYTGPQGIAGCQATGGTVTCVGTVPLENQGGEGTVEAHWRESVFNTEMMTGFLDITTPISKMTIGSLQDLGFGVNASDFDDYTIAIGSLRSANLLALTPPGWEKIRQPIGIIENGRVRPVGGR